MPELIEQIEARVAELTTQRDAFVESANREIAAFNGALEELQRLLRKLREGAE